MYQIKKNKVYRDGVAIADVVGEDLDFYKGKAKYRSPAIKALRDYLKTKDTKKEVKEKVDVSIDSNKKEETVYDILSDIVGANIPPLKIGQTWRGTKYRDILMVNYSNIIKSNLLSVEEKRKIIKAFI